MKTSDTKYGFEPMPSRWGIGPQFLLMDESGTGGGVSSSAGNGDAGSATAANGGTGQATAPAGRTFSQTELDEIVKERLAREKQTREKEALKVKEQADADALKKNQEWQTLAEKNAAKVAELEPLSEQVARYKGALDKYLVDEKKDLPKHVLVLLEKLDPVDQMEYIAANRAELKTGSTGTTDTAKTTGVPASPLPKQKTLSEEEQNAARRGQAAMYQNF